MAKKKVEAKKLPVVEKSTELSEAQKNYLIQNRTKDTEENLASILNTEVSVVKKFLTEFAIKNNKTEVSTDSYAIRGGAIAMTPAASMQGDENEREFNRLAEKPRDGIFYTGKKKHLNDQ